MDISDAKNNIIAKMLYIRCIYKNTFCIAKNCKNSNAPKKNYSFSMKQFKIPNIKIHGNIALICTRIPKQSCFLILVKFNRRH